MNFVHWVDWTAENAVAAWHRHWLDAVLTGVTHLGDQLTLAVVMLLAVAVLFIGRLRRTALIVALTALAGFLISEGVKDLVERGRPHVPWRVIPLPDSPSFPSGHALGSMAVYGAVALTAGLRLRRREARIAAVALGLALPLLIGFSRIYLGVHWLTDVLAGWLIGLAVVLPAAWIDRRWGTRRQAASPSPATPPGRAGPA